MDEAMYWQIEMAYWKKGILNWDACWMEATIWKYLSGLTMEDSIAFPYGKAAQEGIKTVPQGDELLM